MIEYFEFAGKSSVVFGVVMAEKWTDAKPEQSYEETTIEGRDGAIITPAGFSMVKKEISCTLLNEKHQEGVMAWLRGEGVFKIGGRYRNAYIMDEIQYKRIGVKKLSFTLPLLMEPFWYYDDPYKQYKNGELIENAGNYTSVPLIKITGSGDGKITLGGVPIEICDLQQEELIIDCKEKEENYPGKVVMGFKYPTLSPGKNVIDIEGDIKVEVKRKDRWMG
jgi:phage-related protein